MEPISETIVEETWQEISGYTPERASREMMQFGKSQPNLLSFVIELTEELGEQAEELAVYLLFVVHSMFQKGYGRKIRKITQKEVIESFEKNGKLLESLEKAHEKFFERVAETQVSSQPFIIKYIVDTLFEEPEDDDEEPLGEEEIGHIFLLLKTVVDVLNRKTEIQG